MKTIKEILMDRDGNTESEALRRIEDVQIYITEELPEEDDQFYAYEVLRDELDLDGSYLMELMDY